MKFFTKVWWEKAGSGDLSPVERYQAYLASIVSALPPALVELEAGHTLHDSHVISMLSDFTTRRVSLVLDGWDRPLQKPVRYALVFDGVLVFEQQLPAGRDYRSELGDLGYWEIELLTGGGVEVRLLFAGGAEFRVVFGDFRFTHEARG
jgi:hypothetical protein